MLQRSRLAGYTARSPFSAARLACRRQNLPRQVDTVIIVLKPNVTEQQIEHVVQRVEALGLKAHLSRGTYRTIIGVIGDEAKTQVGAAAKPFPAWPRSCRSCLRTSWPASKLTPSRALWTWRASSSAAATWA